MAKADRKMVCDPFKGIWTLILHRRDNDEISVRLRHCPPIFRHLRIVGDLRSIIAANPKGDILGRL